jgi:hypothetical protein
MFSIGLYQKGNMGKMFNQTNLLKEPLISSYSSEFHLLQINNMDQSEEQMYFFNLILFLKRPINYQYSNINQTVKKTSKSNLNL